MIILDAGGKTLELRNKLGEGGEGSVWASPGRADRAIKIYLQPVNASKADKLAAMVSVADAPLLLVAAWPSAIVYDSTRKPVGFEMPKLAGQRALHEIFGTKSRTQTFPSANWHLLVHAAVNLAAAFANLHARGIVVGDVNSNNVVIQDDARVSFIDCDSFQISTPTRRFRCDVGVAEYQPPELQAVSLAGVDRTPQHDVFGMAVLIFQLLFLGKHPFMGRLPNAGANPPTIDQNIKLGNYFYDETAKRAGLQPPPASLSMGAVTPEVAGLFERAFRGAPSQRPSAVEWKSALQLLEANIGACAVNPVHRYVKGIQCPWCTIEIHQNIVYFSSPSLVGPGGVVDESIWASFPQADVDRLWAEIAKVAPPNVTYEATKPQRRPEAKPIDDDLRAKGRRFVVILCFLTAVAIVLAALPKVRPYESLDATAVLLVWLLRPRGGVDFASRREALKNGKRSFERAEDEWRHICHAPDFTALRARLAKIRTTLSGQRAVYDAELAHARLTAEVQAKQQYLDSQLIRNAKIKGIGLALTSRLQIWNIESALDITHAVYQVQGIGPAKAQALFEWRLAVERRFRFDAKMVDGLLNDVKMRHARQRAQGRNELRAGPQMLHQTVIATEARAHAARAKAIQMRAVLDQAKADMSKMSQLMYR